MNKEEVPKINKLKLIPIIIITLIVFIYILYNIIELIKSPADILVVEYGKISEEEEGIGVIIRDEIVVSGENEENGLVQIKNEGERVSKGEAVFRYYMGNEDELNDKIRELDGKIEEALNGQSSIYSNDIKILENQIEDFLEKIRRTNDINKIKEYKKSINNSITKKAQIIGELSPSGTYIKDLIYQRANLEKELNSEVEYVNAPVSGIVSYRIDGLEEIFSIDKLSSISKQNIDEINYKTGQIIGTSNSKGKVINNFYSYIAVVLKSEEAQKSKIGDNVTLRLITSTEINAEIVDKRNIEDDSILMIFKITKGVEELINYRKIAVDIIWWSDKGLKVANSSIGYENEIPYVIKNVGGNKYKVYVKIISTNGNYSIVNNYISEEYKKLGFSDEEIKSMKKLTLYDEILLTP